MKTLKKTLLPIFLCLIIFTCSKKDDGNDIEPSLANWIVYKNQTGNFNADALQAQHKDSNGTLNFYGLFDSNNNPTTIKTLTYQKTNNDTIVNLIIDPLTSKLTSSYISVNGVKSDVVMKFDYTSDTNLNISVHQYDWNTKTSNIIYRVDYVKPKNTTNKMVNLKSSKKFDWDVLGVMAAVAEVGLFIEGGVSATFTGPIILALVKSAVTLAVAHPVSAIGIAIASIAIITPSDAFSEELEPLDIPYPENTPIDNPITTEENPTPIATNPCTDSNLSVIIGTDPGNKLYAIASGDFDSYDYYWSTGEAEVGFTSHITAPDDGVYYVMVKDENGCTAFASSKHDLFSDAQIVKSFLDINGIDVSDPRWDSENKDDIIEILTINEVIPSITSNSNKLRVRQIYFIEKGISTIPEIIGGLSELISLNLSNPPPPFDNGGVNNSITSLPKSIGNLSNLEILEIAYNNLTTIPESIGNLTELTGLDLSYNNLSSIPDSIGNCTKLISLKLSNNNIVNLVNSITNLTQLQTINLEKNNITSFPSIENFNELATLNLDYNNLTSIPSSIGGLSNLTWFDITFNPNLNCLPKEIWNSPSIGAASYGQYFYSGTGISDQNDTDCTN